MIEMIDLRSLKKTVMRDYPEDSPIRKIIMAQPDTMPKSEFIIKSMDWAILIPVKREA